MEEGEADGERLGCCFVGSVILRPFGDELHLLWCQVGEGLLEGGLIEVGLFVGPTIEIGDFDLSLLIDEYVVGPDIADFAVDPTELSRAAGQRIQQIPQLFLLEMFVHFDTVLDLFLEEVGVVLVEDLSQLVLVP